MAGPAWHPRPRDPQRHAAEYTWHERAEHSAADERPRPRGTDSDRSASPSDEGRPKLVVLWLTCDAHVFEHPPGEVDRLADLGDVSGASRACIDVLFKEAAVAIVEHIVEMQRDQLDGLGAADAGAGVNRLVRTHGGAPRGRCGLLCGRGAAGPAG